jgi:hypothetical protein
LVLVITEADSRQLRRDHRPLALVKMPPMEVLPDHKRQSVRTIELNSANIRHAANSFISLLFALFGSHRKQQ